MLHKDRTLIQRIELMRPQAHDIVVLHMNEPMTTQQARTFRQQLKGHMSQIIPDWNGLFVFLPPEASLRAIPAAQAQSFVDALFEMPWVDEASIAAIKAMFATKEKK